MPADGSPRGARGRIVERSGARRGRVVLVGAGPGDPDLLTVKAARALAAADVVLTDALVDARILALAAGARIVDVGKRRGGRGAGKASTPQDDINARLLAEAKAGHVVVRLKGGDPFVFGRGGEEAVFLAAHGVDVDVVPGLSSALAVPAVHGVPVTHRGVAQAFTVLTGTAASSATDLEAQWTAAAKVGGTLVFLMAVHVLDRVAAACARAGLAPSTPVAIVVDGTQAGEQVVVTTLQDVVQDAARAGVRAPAVIVIGEVVRVREALAAAGAADVRV